MFIEEVFNGLLGESRGLQRVKEEIWQLRISTALINDSDEGIALPAQGGEPLALIYCEIADLEDIFDVGVRQAGDKDSILVLANVMTDSHRHGFAAPLGGHGKQVALGEEFVIWSKLES